MIYEETLAALIKPLIQAGSCGTPSFSPDGNSLAFTWNVSGSPQLWLVSCEGESAWPRQLTALEDPVIGVRWSPDNAWLAVNIAPGGGMNQQIYLIRPDGSGLQRLTNGGRDNNWLTDWSLDGRFLTFSSNQLDSESIDCFMIEINVQGAGPVRLVNRNKGTGRVQTLDKTGQRAVVGRVENRSDNNLFLVELPGPAEQVGRESLLTPHSGPATSGQAHFSPDGTAIYLATNIGRDRMALGRVGLAENGLPGPVEMLAGREDAELDQLAVAPDSGELLLVWNQAGNYRLEWFDPATGQTRPGPALPAEIVVELEFSQDGRRLVLWATGSTQPANLWLLDLTTPETEQRFRQLTYSHHPAIVLESLVKPEAVAFKAHDGLTLSGWLYRAPGQAEPGPLVLSFHGGPEAQEQPVFNPTYQALLTSGLSVLAPNVRGSTGFGKQFANLDNGPLRFDAIRDIKACIDYSVEAGIAAPGRIGITGGSYGGYMTMAGLVEYPELIAAGVNQFGIVNFQTFFEQTEPWMAAISKIEYGDPDTQRDLLHDLSPIHRIDRVKSPTLVIHGANDTNCPVVEAEQVVDSLKERGVPVEYILFPDEGHGFRKLPNRITAIMAMVGWFKQYL